jgi:hypothetical protein
VLDGSRRYHYRGVILALAVTVCAFVSAGALATKPRCVSGQTLTACAGALVNGLVAGDQCQSDLPSPPPGPQAQMSTADWLQRLIEDLPCPSSGRVAYDEIDDHGDSMSVLDPIPNPQGGYLGVYHTAFRPPGDPFTDFRISLAQSSDLIHWTRVEVLDPSGASMPTLRAIAGSPGYLLAYEKSLARGDVVRLRYYPSLAALLAGRYSAQRDLPRDFSPFNDGTPTILWARWNGSLWRSVIELGFHYETARKWWRGPDREAIGTLRGFRMWSARTDPSTDAALSQQGLVGSHGDWRQFGFEGSRWRVYEAQTSYNDFGTWRVVLENPSSDQMYSLALRMGAQTVASSFANPVARVEPGPGGQGQALVVTMYLFSGPAPGELVYYQPL